MTHNYGVLKPSKLGNKLNIVELKVGHRWQKFDSMKRQHSDYLYKRIY